MSEDLLTVADEDQTRTPVGLGEQNFNQLNPSSSQEQVLPIKRNLRPVFILACAIAAIMAASSLAGLFYQSAVYPTDALIRSFVANDVVNLFIGLPVLLGSMYLVKRGRLVGLLLWPGALLYVLYNYIVYAIAVPFNLAFILDLALVVLSFSAFISLAFSVDGQSVKRRLAGSVREKVTGGILSGLGLIFFLQATGALMFQTSMARSDLATHVSDLLITSVWIIGGILLWRRKDIGYAMGLGLLFQASMLFIGLIMFLLLQPILTSAPFALTNVVVIFFMGLVCFIPFVLFVRGVISKLGRGGGSG